ncbi:ABC transporter substrate-binding protein [Kutzneria sp. NPDC051319]|uniref:ABC transporter substrate-binding protein n=1 Tax=Kutzneria sp. NPDC051319 TaxID=3155047 RepID=UPI0034315057
MKPPRSVLFGLIAVLAAVTAGCAPGAGGAAAGDKVTLLLNWYPYGEHAPFYYGKQQGVFAKYGIDLTIQPGQGSGRTVQATAAGQADFGWADTPALLSAVDQGMHVVSTGVYLQTTPASVQFFGDKGIRTPADLKGRTVASTAGDALSRTFPIWLKANGLSPDDVQLQNTDAAGKIAAVISGRTDALLGNATDQGPTVQEKAGRPVTAMRFADHGLNFFSDGLITATGNLTAKKDLVSRMAEATSQAWQQAAKDPDAAVAAMRGASAQLPSAAVLAQQFAATLTLLHTAATKDLPPGVDDESDWRATISVLATAGLIKVARAPSAYWDGGRP